MDEAKLAAKQALDVLKDPKADAKKAAALKEKIKLSAPMGRNAPIPELGFNKQLAEAVFNAQQGQWLAEPYKATSGYVVAKLVVLNPPEEKNWEGKKDQWIQTMESSAQQEIFQAFLQELMNEATIKIARGDVLK